MFLIFLVIFTYFLYQFFHIDCPSAVTFPYRTGAFECPKAHSHQTKQSPYNNYTWLYLA